MLPGDAMSLKEENRQQDVASVVAVQAEWEHLGATDPLWAVLNDPTRTNGRWDEGEFFASGVREIDTVFRWLDQRGIDTASEGTAIDFGCGVGRLTRALGQRFQRAVGVDCSESMVRRAKMGCHKANAEFIVNTSDDLAAFPSGTFDFGLTLIVLQHIPPPGATNYLRELLRLLKPDGILVFQVPTDYLKPRLDALSRIKLGWRSLRAAVALRTRLRRLLKSDSDGQQDARVVRMFCIPEKELVELIAAANAEVVASAYTNSCDADYNGALRIGDDAPISRFTSRLFAVRKR